MSDVLPPSKATLGLAIVVEDSPPNRQIVEYLLKELGFDVLSFPNALEAINGLTDVDFSVLRIVITDIMMPGINGIEFVRRLKVDPRYELIPCVAITAVADKSMVEMAREAGMRSYLLKPLSATKIVECLQKNLPDLKLNAAVLKRLMEGKN